MTSAKPAKRPTIRTLKQVREEMARVYADARQGRLPAGEASRLTYVLGQLAGVIEGEAVEQRLIELERRTAR